MFHSVLVVCVGNICRSPLGERVLAKALPEITVHSAGLSAVVGHGADKDMAQAAEEIGVDLSGHVAQQLTGDLGAAHELILVMEPAHRAEIFQRYPALSGRVMLFDHWKGGSGIDDPYRQSREVHRATRDRIVDAAQEWIARLAKGSAHGR